MKVPGLPSASNIHQQHKDNEPTTPDWLVIISHLAIINLDNLICLSHDA